MLFKYKKVCFFFLALSFLTGFLTDRYLFSKKQSSSYKAIRDHGYKYTSPLLFLESPQENTDFLKGINNLIETYIDEQESKGAIINVSVYLRYPKLSDWMVINPEVKYSPASLLKVPILMLYYNKAENNPSLLSTEIKFDINDNNLMSNYKPKENLEKDKSYKISELLKRMIIYSDNAAEDLLILNTSKEEFNRIFDDINVERLNFEQQENSMDVKTYSHFFRALYNSTFLTRNASEKTLELLTKTTFDKGVAAVVPKNIPVAHKFGERYIVDIQEAQLHDCGIVYFPNNPYLLCIMTRGKDFKILEKILQDISEITYKYTSQN